MGYPPQIPNYMNPPPNVMPQQNCNVYVPLLDLFICVERLTS